MKSKLLLLFFTCSSLVFSQEYTDDECEKLTNESLNYLRGTNNVTRDIKTGLKKLIELAQSGCEMARESLSRERKYGTYSSENTGRAINYADLLEKGNTAEIEKLSKLCEEGTCDLSVDERFKFHNTRFGIMGCEEKTSRSFTLLKGSDRVKPDVKVAEGLLIKYAIESKCEEAQLRIGKEYMLGRYVDQNNTRALQFLTMAKEQGSIEAIELLAKLCSSGVGCDLSEDEKSTIFEERLDALSCEEKANKALKFIKGSSYIAVDVERGLRLLTEFAQDGCSQARYELGKLYKKGYKDRVAIDYDKAFYHFQIAVNQNHPRAHAHLGQLYERGNGCKLDYNQSMELYEKCYALGDDMGAYCIGYNYMKGLGSIEQDYSQAISWYGKSEYPMARHWLAVLNYFGFGMPVNKDRAIELLATNEGRILNSPRLLNHLQEHINDEGTILSDFKGLDIEKETQEVNEVLTAANESQSIISVEKETEELTAIDLKGDWTGKLIELDWSGNQIVRNFPITMTFNQDQDTGGVSYTANVADTTNAGLGILLDDSLYFQNFQFSIPRLYRDRLNPNINLDVLSADIELKKVNHITFLTAYVDSRILNWNEPGTPMLLVLSKNGITTENGVEISEELINELFNNQDDSFINLFPNPFEKDLLIQYDLAEQSNTSVELYGLDGVFYKKIVDNEMQPEGKKLYYFDGTTLVKGLYVVRITANNVVFTKLIAKQ